MDYPWPFSETDPRYCPEAFDEALEFNVEMSVSRSGKVNTLGLPGARWRAVMQFPDTTVAYLRERRQIEAFLASLRGGANRLLKGNHLTPLPLGTARGTPALAAAVAVGDSTAVINGCLAGANVLTTASYHTVWNDGWTAVNGTVAYGNVPGATPGDVGNTFTRTAVGNHYLTRTFSTGAMVNKSANLRVLVKAGTLTGDVVLRLRDGAGGHETSLTLTAQPGWTLHKVSAYFPPGAANDLQIFVDPSNDAGSAGDTLLISFAELSVSSAVVANAAVDPFGEAAPAGYSGNARYLISAGAGNTFSRQDVTRAVAVGEVWTYSGKLRAVSGFAGGVTLRLRDQADVEVASVIVTPTGAWTPFSLTGTYASGATQLRAFIDPVNNAAAAGETLAVYGDQLEPGAVATEFYPVATLLRGDRIAFGGQRVMLTADGAANTAGQMVIAFEPAHRAGAASAAAVTLARPTTKYIVATPVVQMPARGSLLPGFAVELVEE